MVQIAINEILLLRISFVVVMTHVILDHLFVANYLVVIDALELFLTQILAIGVLIIPVGFGFLFVEFSMLLILVFNGLLDLL